MNENDLAIAKAVGILHQENPRGWEFNPLDEDPLAALCTVVGISLFSLMTVSIIFILAQMMGVI